MTDSDLDKLIEMSRQEIREIDEWIEDNPVKNKWIPILVYSAFIIPVAIIGSLSALAVFYYLNWLLM